MSNKVSLWKAILNKRMLICIFNGFTAGLPLFYIYHLIPAWLRSEGVNLKTIGLFALVGIPYTWKFLWSPVMDRYTPPFLGRRRGWMIITQIALMFTMCAFAFTDAKQDVWTIAYVAAALAFFSASQDVVLDAYRRELLPDEELGLGNAMYVNGYRAAVFVPGGLGLILADYLSWAQVHQIIALFMLVGIILTLVTKEAPGQIEPPKTIVEAVVDPFREFITRDGIASALLLLAFLFLYKIGDNMATALATPFYLDMGFSKTIIGTMVKLVGFWSMIIGGTIGGIIMLRIGINRALWLFGVVQIISILGFAVLSEFGGHVRLAAFLGYAIQPLDFDYQALLGAVVGFEYLGVGLGTSAFVAYMARATNKNFTATQFALFSSLMALPRTFANASTGYITEAVGWTNFFGICTLSAIPGMILLFWCAPWNTKENESNQQPSTETA